MIGHPNNSGLQMDQITHLYIPPFFVNDLHVWQDDKLILAMDGGISISEDPNIRFTYRPGAAKKIRAEAKGHRRPRFPGRVAGRVVCDVTSRFTKAAAHLAHGTGCCLSRAPTPLETPHLRLRLCAAQIIDRTRRLFG